jgi:hypothetical protein
MTTAEMADVRGYDQIEQAGEELNAVAKYDIRESKLCLGDGTAI